MTITITVNVAGTLDPDDKRAAISKIVEINRLREKPLAFGTGAEIKASYETILSEQATSIHLQNIETASTATGLEANGYTDEDMKAIRKVLADKAQSGRSIASIVSAVRSI